MSHAITFPRLHTIACPNTSFRATDGFGGSTRGYQALSTGCERSKALMVGKRSEPSDSIEDISETINRRRIERRDGLQRAYSLLERAMAVYKRARIADQRSTKALERAMVLEEEVKKLRCDVDALEKKVKPVHRFFHGAHIKNFIDFCVEIFIDGTEEERRRGACYASYENWVNAQTTSVVTITTETDVFGPRTLDVPIDALRAMQQAVPAEDNLSTNLVDDSRVRDIAISIQFMDEGKGESILSKSELYLLFEVCFGIPVDDCVDSKNPVWANTTVPLNSAEPRGYIYI